MTHHGQLRDRYCCFVNPVWLTSGVGSQLIDGDDFVGGIAISIKGLMAGDAIKGNALYRADDRLAEGFAPCRIIGILRRVRPIGQGSLDRLDDDVGAVIGRCTVDTEIGSSIDRTVLIAERLCGRTGGGIDYSYRAKG